ncbi:MAG: hypothetical protein K1X79_13160 [Oligoflexia bacterium]|nr:hypothetical protein [Oligoflexia bacterium]
MATKDRGSVLVQLMRLLSKPIARFAIRHSLGVRDILEAAKVSLIEAAIEEIERRKKRVTISQIATLTGIHRKDVYRIYEHGRANNTASSISMRVVGQWLEDRRFTTAAGKPRVLSCETEESDFNKLVYSLSTDVHPHNVLFQLERFGLVKRAHGKVTLLSRVFDGDGDPVEGFRFLAQDLEDLLVAVEENVLQDQDVKNLHVTSEYDRVLATDVPEIKRWLMKQGSAFHRKVRTYLAKYDLDVNPGRKKKEQGPLARIAVGSFCRSQVTEVDEEELQAVEEQGEESAVA